MIDFSEYQLGMRREAVALKYHYSLWAEAYRKLSTTLIKKLEGSGIEFHHIGSTSIPGIKAKPILDVMGVVESIKVFDSYQALLESSGFEWKGEYGIVGRRYCVLYDTPKTAGFVHLHVFERNHPEVVSHLFFRDFLLANPSVAREYGELKEALEKIFTNDRSRYTEAKAGFIQDVLARK